MEVKDIMSRDLVVVSPNVFLDRAAHMMKSKGVGILPILTGARVVGVVTDRDIATKAVARGWVPAKTRVRDVMTEDLFWCFEDTHARDAARLMGKNAVHRLLVFARDMTLQGVVSLDDIALAFRDDRELARTVRDISFPSVAYRSAA